MVEIIEFSTQNSCSLESYTIDNLKKPSVIGRFFCEKFFEKVSVLGAFSLGSFVVLRYCLVTIKRGQNAQRSKKWQRKIKYKQP